MLRKIAVYISLWLGGFVAFAQNSPDDVKTFTLPNGMKFLVLEDHSIPTANMYFFWKVGARNEVHGITVSPIFLNT